MKWIRVFLAFATAGALAFAASQLAVAPAASEGASRTPLVPADSIDAERIGEIVLERDGIRYRFEKRGSAWQQTEPVVHAIDGWSMRQLIGKVLKAESVRDVALPAGDAAAREKALADAGLSPVAARIELRETAAAAEGTGAGRSVTVELGRRSLAGRAYARRADAGGSSYQVIDGALHEYALGRDPKEFRRRELFADLGEVERLAFRSGDNQLVLAREGRTYRLESPVRSRADRVQAEELFDALRRAKSGGFVSDKPMELAAYGLAPAMATIEVDSGGTRRALLIGDAVSIGAQDRFGMLDGTTTVVRLPAAVLAPIIPRVERLIDGVASGVRARDVAAIEIAAGPRRMSLKRETDGWSASVGGQGAPATDPGSKTGTADRERVDGLLKALTETRAASVELGQFPAAESIATVTFVGFAGEPLDTVRIARRAADSKFLLENGDGVLRVHGAIELPLSPDELGFRAKP